MNREVRRLMTIKILDFIFIKTLELFDIIFSESIILVVLNIVDIYEIISGHN